MEQPEICAIVFDLDGTLIDSNGLKQQAFFDIFREFEESRMVVHEVLRRHRRAGRRCIIEAIVDCLRARGVIAVAVSDSFVEEKIEEYGTICEDGAGSCPEMPGASHVLHHLAKNHWLHVNSGTPEASLQRIVQGRQWKPLFRSVHGWGRGKAGVLSCIARRCGYTPPQMLMVGDDDDDARGASQFGCHFAGYQHPTAHFSTRPAVQISRLSELISVV